MNINEKDIEAHKSELQSLMKFAKETGPDMLGGRFDRLKKSGNEVCWQNTSRDGKTVYVTYFKILATPNSAFSHVRLIGLDLRAEYVLDGDVAYNGAALMQNGISVPSTDKDDFTSRLFIFKKTET